MCEILIEQEKFKWLKCFARRNGGCLVSHASVEIISHNQMTFKVHTHFKFFVCSNDDHLLEKVVFKEIGNLDTTSNLTPSDIKTIKFH